MHHTSLLAWKQINVGMMPILQEVEGVMTRGCCLNQLPDKVNLVKVLLDDL
jgi:hypothetical protein